MKKLLEVAQTLDGDKWVQCQDTAFNLSHVMKLQVEKQLWGSEPSRPYAVVATTTHGHAFVVCSGMTKEAADDVLATVLKMGIKGGAGIGGALTHE